jgi:hypothetical protein
MIHGSSENKYRRDMRVLPTPMASLNRAIGALAARPGLLILTKFDQSVT